MALEKVASLSCKMGVKQKRAWPLCVRMPFFGLPGPKKAISLESGEDNKKKLRHSLAECPFSVSRAPKRQFRARVVNDTPLYTRNIRYFVPFSTLGGLTGWPILCTPMALFAVFVFSCFLHFRKIPLFCGYICTALRVRSASWCNFPRKNAVNLCLDLRHSRAKLRFLAFSGHFAWQKCGTSLPHSRNSHTESPFLADRDPKRQFRVGVAKVKGVLYRKTHGS